MSGRPCSAFWKLLHCLAPALVLQSADAHLGLHSFDKLLHLLALILVLQPKCLVLHEFFGLRLLLLGALGPACLLRTPTTQMQPSGVLLLPCISCACPQCRGRQRRQRGCSRSGGSVGMVGQRCCARQRRNGRPEVQRQRHRKQHHRDRSHFAPSDGGGKACLHEYPAAPSTRADSGDCAATLARMSAAAQHAVPSADPATEEGG